MAKAAAAINRADPSGLALADLQAKLAAEARRAAAGPAPVDEPAEGGAEEGAGGAEAQPAPIAAKAGPGKPRPAPPKFANPPPKEEGGEQREEEQREEAPPSAAAPPAPKPKPHEALRGGLNVRAKAKEDAAAVALRRAREKFEREMAILQRAEGLEEEEEEEDGGGAHGDLWAPSGKAYQL